MLKPEYINRFSISTNNATKDAQISFFNVSTIIVDALTPGGSEVHEIASIVMTENTLRDLHQVTGDALKKIDEPVAPTNN